MKNNNHHPINPLGKHVKYSEKKRKNKILLEEDKYVIEPNILVPFKNVIRVQTNHYLEYDNDLVSINKELIIADYGKDFYPKIRKYLKFINVPEHINYRKEIGIYYNLYRPISHKPKQGDFPNIEKMLKHIFRGKHYEMILTYIWALYIHPKQPLPFIGLISKSKGTGKTKFLQLLKSIFEANAKFIDAEDISSSFNSSYMDKLCILIDEKIDGKNRKSDLQKYKKLITGGTQTRKEKYQNDVDIEFYGKFMMCSNDDQTMLALEKENTRFWIVDVAKLKETDVDILNKVIAEIPAFLYYLEIDFKPMPKKGRLWFNPKELQTERSKILQENSKSEVAKEIIERLTNYFIENGRESKIKFSTEHFLQSFPMHNIKGNYFSRILKDEFNKETTLAKINNPFLNTLDAKRCRCFTFLRDEIIKDVEVTSAGDASKADDKIFYDSEWIDGEFD